MMSPLLKCVEGDYFQKNTFHERGGDTFEVQVYGGLFYRGGLMIRSYRGGRSFTKWVSQ